METQWGKERAAVLSRLCALWAHSQLLRAWAWLETGLLGWVFYELEWVFYELECGGLCPDHS